MGRRKENNNTTDIVILNLRQFVKWSDCQKRCCERYHARGEKLQTYDTIEYKSKMNCKLKCEDPKMYFRPDP